MGLDKYYLNRRASALVAALLMVCSGCGLDAVDVDESIVAKDAWDYANRPETFDLPLTRSLEALPLQGEAETIPWTETYWPSWTTV